MYDVIIIGMGPAGMNAGIYAKRSGLNVLMLEKNKPGGLINITNRVDNYLGFSTISGASLAEDMLKHIESEKVDYKIETVIDIKQEDNKKIVITDKNTYECKAIILCGGRQPKKLRVEENKSLIGKGLSNCATCDAPLYRGKEVAIVGDGNSAFEEGIYLADFASKVYILDKDETHKADEVLQEKVQNKSNIVIKKNVSIKEIKLTNDFISSIVLNTNEELNVEGLFVYIGYVPATEYLKNLEIVGLDGYIEVDKNMRTKVKGIYAAGDNISKNLYQIITAASDGAIAAISCKKDIENL